MDMDGNYGTGSMSLLEHIAGEIAMKSEGWTKNRKDYIPHAEAALRAVHASVATLGHEVYDEGGGNVESIIDSILEREGLAPPIRYFDDGIDVIGELKAALIYARDNVEKDTGSEMSVCQQADEALARAQSFIDSYYADYHMNVA